jgi:hypothetical protein
MEMDIKRKDVLGQGSRHAVYPLKTHPDRVVKVGHSIEIVKNSKGEYIEKEIMTPYDYYQLSMFKRYPDIFPKVISSNEKYMVIERMNTDLVVKDNLYIHDELLRLGYKGDNDDLMALYIQAGHSPSSSITQIIEQIPNQGLVKKYIKFFTRVHEVFESEGFDTYDFDGEGLDLHTSQFGYTSEGNLKLFDF